MTPIDGYFFYLVRLMDELRQGDKKKQEKWVDELKEWPFWRAVIAEFMATFLFIFISTMSAVDMDTTVDPSAKYVKVGLTFGIMIAVGIQMIGHVSGGHINPAVSLAMAVARQISPLRAVFYVLAQLSGGMCGSLLLKGVTPSRFNDNLGLTAVNSELNAGQAFACELVYTFILVVSVFGCTDPNRALLGSPALSIGFTVAALHFASIPFTGAGFNPARSFAVSVVSNSFEHHWVYWVGPMVGSVAAALAYKFVLCPYKSTSTYPEVAAKIIQSGEVSKHQPQLKHGNDKMTLADISV
ncbi:aquaporin-1-like [Mya arenaria]|uniref:aquaporin-1-like n=1 Tax=Mya arenaria TaxID=6604 RepID=UPI0022E73523|nr:aquaporin-1-like [Mya arenaria]